MLAQRLALIRRMRPITSASASYRSPMRSKKHNSQRRKRSLAPSKPSKAAREGVDVAVACFETAVAAREAERGIREALDAVGPALAELVDAIASGDEARIAQAVATGEQQARRSIRSYGEPLLP
jgi:hypothetical protein